MDKYRYIILCDLVRGSTVYKNQYLLVKNKYDVKTETEIDLKGGCMFNTDFEVQFPLLIREINSIQDLKDFCENYDIDIQEHITKDGLIAGGAKGLLVNNNLEPVGWVENIEEEME